ncbi:response regulator [Actinoplanes regularis]|uniref:Two-component system, OmpR family, KDP operon response regulator KdpE n=1 Tax=Actinoplanes regularis TaxID=52697 RepID=A0A238UYS1_9ACTN|nr:response regulator [Actinoplanes regularis]GIE84187.1 response regulator [Actinoplanes regularis]GLW28785.1 response regulator [Actinoplanes regularis]SNR27360.1 two-component system, OmpR family, KDP operon response regulator KdpE [Actinoplanes regularis]
MSDRHRILLVEDEELNRMLVKAVLSRASVDAVRNAELVDAGTLTEARERVRDTVLDLILLDLNLPDGNGLTLARELKADDPPLDRPKPVVVAVTASVLPQDQKAALDAGCDDFLDKPYAAADLVATVARHLHS